MSKVIAPKKPASRSATGKSAASKPADKPANKLSTAKPASTAPDTVTANKVKPAGKPVSKAPAAVKADGIANSRAQARTPAVKAKPAVRQTASARQNGVAASAPVIPSKTREKIKEPKLVRDSYTMPESEYQAIGTVKRASLKAGFEIKKSEILRIGVQLVQQMKLDDLKDALQLLPRLKTGRPKKVG